MLLRVLLANAGFWPNIGLCVDDDDIPEYEHVHKCINDNDNNITKNDNRSIYCT